MTLTIHLDPTAALREVYAMSALYATQADDGGASSPSPAPITTDSEPALRVALGRALTAATLSLEPWLLTIDTEALTVDFSVPDAAPANTGPRLRCLLSQAVTSSVLASLFRPCRPSLVALLDDTVALDIKAMHALLSRLDTLAPLEGAWL